MPSVEAHLEPGEVPSEQQERGGWPGGCTSPVALSTQEIAKSYGGLVAVDRVSLQLFEGEVLGLIGPNGAGKTTLVDLIAGTQAATTGTAFLGAEPLVGSPSRRSAAGLARTFQHPQLAGELTIEENIAIGIAAVRLRTGRGTLRQFIRAGLYEDRRDYHAARRWAEEVGLTACERTCQSLSLGEQRLVEVARAMAQSPRVVLLDEPFAGSDATGMTAISRAISTLRQRGCSTLLVDHNVDLVTSLVDRVILLNEGRVAFDGSPHDCLASPAMRDAYFGGEK